MLGLRVPLSEVSVTPNPGSTPISLFASVFLSSRVGAVARGLFARVALPGQVLTNRITDNLGALAAALGAQTAEVLTLLPVAGSDVISHAALTGLYRHITLARALGVAVGDVRLLIALTGLEPLGAAVLPTNSSSSQRAAGFGYLVAFAKAAAKLAESGLGIPLAAEILLPESSAVRQMLNRPVEIKSDDQITSELKSLRKALRDIRPVAKADIDALKDQVQEALSLVMDSAVARQVVAALTNPQQTADRQLIDALSGETIASRDPFRIGLITPPQASDLLSQASTQTMEQRLTRALAAVGDYAQRAVLVQTVGHWTGLTEATVCSVLRDRLKVDPVPGGGPSREALSVLTDQAFWSAADTAPVVGAIITWAKRLDRLMAMFKGVDAGLALSVLAGRAWQSSILPAAVSGAVSPWQTLEPVLDLRWLAQSTQLSEATLLDHLTALAASGAAANLPATVAPLARRLGVEPADALVMMAQVAGAVAMADALRNPATLRRLTELAAIGRPLRATASQLAILAGNDPVQVSLTARQLLAARVGAEAWPQTLTSVSDTLRKQQRDALVAYLQQGALDVTSLYDKLLIDPMVQPCFMTTRITQAVASVQLLIQRILFGLEPDAMVSETLRDRWSWMRSYRLWEANRKVFLYPENWLFPDLRDDKSASFRRLEANLSQGELSHERAGQAYGQFLADINDIGQTQVLGLFEDVDALSGTGVPRKRRDLYMVGRSPSPPYTYHWRRCQDFGKRWMEWSPWERIELDIQGDHVVPFLVNGRFHVAWPVFQKQAKTGAQTTDKWRIELAWSQFDGQAWRKVSTSRDDAPPIQPIDEIAFENERSGFAFRPYVTLDGTNPTVYAYVKVPVSKATVTMEKAPDSTPTNNIIAPPRLVALTGIAELVSLLVGHTSELKKYCELNPSFSDYYDVMQLYCAVWGQTTWGHPPNVKIARYAGLAKPLIFSNQATLRWHRVERAGLAKDFVDSVTFREEDIRNFITDYRTHYWNVANFTYGSWTGSGSANHYEELVKAILANCSSRTLQYRAWVRLPSSRSSTGDLLPLQAADGTFSLEVAGAVTMLNPGVLSDQMIRAGEAGASMVTLVWTPSGRQALRSEPLPLEPVGVGQSLIQTLHFEINGIANDGITDASGLASLVQSPRPFKQMRRFILQSTGTMATEVGNDSALEFLDGKSDVWMNGLRETAVSGQSFGLTLPNGSRQNIPVFNTSSYRYWIVGAGAPNATAINQTNIWHFREGNSNCYIDVNPEPGNDASRSGLSIYPSAWSKGDSLSKVWYEAGRLPSGSGQSDDFGASALPALASAIHTAQPTDVLRGPFDNRLPNACYNWEIYFHAPLLIADHLSKQQRFEDAERWLRLVFDPHSAEPGLPDSFLRFLVFREMPRGLSAGSDLKTLAKAAANNTSSPSIDSMKALISRWRSQPYRPFMIARRRQVAFLWRTVFAYLDNLLAWADSLYRRDTREAIAEAAQLYILAARILGPKPRIAAARRSQSGSSYADLAQKWDDFANAWFDAATPAHPQPPGTSTGAGVSGANSTPAPEGFLFFCIPVNEKLNTYWDMVNERLFNIRHCRNIEGITRDLPLTDPPIDPELLVRATAAGLDMADIVNSLFARPLPYRYSVVVARAMDLAADVRAFGSALLSAMEKHDAEQLAQLRSTNEVDLLKRVTDVRKLQIEEAERNLDALRASRAGTAARFEQLQRQLGDTDSRAPGEQETLGEESPLGRLAGGNAAQSSKWGLIVEEQRQLEEQGVASYWTDADSVARIVGGVFSIGASVAHYSPLGITKIGEALSALASASGATADSFRAISTMHQTEASRQAVSAGHIRRRDEWAYQSNQALRELRQIDKQLLANQIRIALAKLEMQNHETQIEQTEAINTYLREKFTNTDLYEWMASQLSSLHTAAYRMALDMARQAERAAAHELGAPPFKIVGNDYWNSQRARLVAGERLQQDLKRLEIAFMEQNRREHELTKHISLRLLNPSALVDLRTTGSCVFRIPEWLFDMDMPGHFMRRIKTVSLSIPCVVGPYASVNAKLTLLRSDLRHSPSAVAPYGQVEDNDNSRFTTRFGATESIVTSNGRDDGGLFETNLRDERYLPFENQGAISRWSLELPGPYPQFDYSTISDVVLTIRYTARDGGESLRDSATAAIGTQLTTAPRLRFEVLLSGKSDFPTEWARAIGASTDFKIPITRDLLPYWMDAAGLTVLKVKYADIPWPEAVPFEFQEVLDPPAVPPTLSRQPYEAPSTSATSAPIPAGKVDRMVLLEVGIPPPRPR